MGTLGSLSWARQTDGRLRREDALRLLAKGVRATLEDRRWALGQRLRLPGNRAATFDVVRLRIPDSAACKEAETICMALRPDFLVGHSYRTYVWAIVLATQSRLAYDEEVLFVSSLLHDTGLSEPHRPSPAPLCFSLVGAERALNAGQRGGWDRERQRRAADAITRHLNIRVTASEGPEAHLMAAGTQLDAVGMRLRRIHPDTVAAVLARYPRRGVKAGLADVLARRGRADVGSRAHFMVERLGTEKLMRKAPFDE